MDPEIHLIPFPSYDSILYVDNLLLSISFHLSHYTFPHSPYSLFLLSLLTNRVTKKLHLILYVTIHDLNVRCEKKSLIHLPI